MPAAHGLTGVRAGSGKPLKSQGRTPGTRLAVAERMARWATRLGLGRWDWRTCWKSLGFWLIVGSIVLPLGFLLLLLPRHPLRVSVRRFRA